MCVIKYLKGKCEGWLRRGWRGWGMGGRRNIKGTIYFCSGLLLPQNQIDNKSSAKVEMILTVYDA